MKSKLNLMKSLKYLFSMVLIGLLFAFTGCSSKDANQILSTIPADVDAMAIIDLESVLTNAGCKVDGSKLTLSPEIKSFLDQAGIDNKTMYEALEKGETGLEFSMGAIFFKGPNTVFTMSVDDPDQLIAYAQKYNYTHRDDSGISVLSINDRDEFFLKGNQIWVVGTGRITTSDITAWTSLDKKKSMLGVDCVVSLLDDNDMGFIFDGSQFNGKLGSASMFSALFMQDTKYLVGGVQIKNHSIEIETSMLNQDYEPAKFNLGMKTIDLKVLDNLRGNAQMVVAMDYPKRLINQVMILMGGSQIPSDIQGSLESIDGTIALSIDLSLAASDPQNMCGSIAFQSSDPSGIISLLKTMGGPANFENKGGMVIGTIGNPSGACTLQPLYKRLDEAYVGILWSSETLKGSLPQELYNAFKEASLVFGKKDDSIKCKIEWNFGGDKTPLVTLMDLVNYSTKNPQEIQKFNRMF